MDYIRIYWILFSLDGSICIFEIVYFAPTNNDLIEHWTNIDGKANCAT